MSVEKLTNTEFKRVVVTYRDPDSEARSVRVGGNDVVIKGKRTLKQYILEVGKEVELPVTLIGDLKSRCEYRRNGKGESIKVPLLYVEAV